MGLTAIAVLFTVSLSLYWIYQHWTSRKAKPLPPGPRGIQTVLSFFSAAKNFTLHQYADRWARRYGDIVSVSLFNQTIVYLNSSDLVRTCFCDGALKFITNDRPSTFATRFVFKDANIGFSPIGSHHTRLRQLVHGALKLYGDGVTSFESMITDELQRLVLEINANEDALLDDIVSTTLLNIIHILLTGECGDEDKHTIREMREYNDAINNLFRVEMDQPLTLLPVLRYLPGSFKTSCDLVKSKEESLIRLLFDKMKSRYTPGEHQQGLIQAALETQQTASDQTRIDDDHIRFLAVELISGAYFTSAGTILGILLVLMEQPDLQERLYSDITAKIGGRMVTVEDRRSIPLVDAIVLEALRYLAHGPTSLPHWNNQEIELKGYRIPKGSIIFSNLWTMGHDENTWEDPWEFRPDRFLDEKGNLLPADHPQRQKYYSFGIGKRQCPGEVFAKTRIFMLLVTLVQHFRFFPPEGGMTSHSDSRTWTPGIIMLPGSIKYRVEVRDTCPLMR